MGQSQPRPQSVSPWISLITLRWLASVRFGVAILLLILVYASIFSALPQVRGTLELTEMAAFSHWLFVTLVVLFMATLTITTLVRIRFNVINLGVLTVHAGLLTFSAGAIWYFATKIEGDVILRSPAVEILAPDETVLTKIEPYAEGRYGTWSEVLPAFGGEVTVSVAAPTARGSAPLEHVELNVRFGANESTLALDPGETSSLGNGLRARLVTTSPRDRFFDRDRAALHIRPVGEDSFRVAPLDALPFHRERLIPSDEIVYDTDGYPVLSKRTAPYAELLGLRIPTGWFESWRLPIDVEFGAAPEAPPFDIRVTGFLPYVRGARDQFEPGGQESNPVLEFGLRSLDGESRSQRRMVANSPRDAFLDAPTPIELRAYRSADERNALIRPMKGPHELRIEVREPPVSLAVAAEIGSRIEVPGTDYVLEVTDLIPRWPMRSEGYEEANSPAALVEVSRGPTRFTRTVMQRFPQLTQDTDVDGVRKRVGLLDENIAISYRSAERGWVYLLVDGTGPELSRASTSTDPVVTIATFNTAGEVKTQLVEINQPVLIAMPATTVEFRPLRYMPRARRVLQPVVEPLETRRPNVASRSVSAIRLEFASSATPDVPPDRRWVIFSQYPDDEARPIRFVPPGSDREWEIIYSRYPRSLGYEVTSDRLLVRYFPGRNSVHSWRSEFFVREDGSDQLQAMNLFTNRTATHGEWTFFQSGAAPDNWSYTILGVGNRVGIEPMVIGCVLITLGSMYAFYIKPVLIRRRASAGIARREGRVSGASDASASPEASAPAHEPGTEAEREPVHS